MAHPIQAVLSGSPYSLSLEGARGLEAALQRLDERVRLLRSNARLTDETLRRYYGDTKFEQIAESNAIEGSTLSVGETEIAVLKGTTLTGHDPGYVRDAQALAQALDRLAELAKSPGPTDKMELKELHELIMEGKHHAGHFRSEPVRISGSAHKPPPTWGEVMDQIERWDAWSKEHANAPTGLRALVLHAWLAHIHPFLDGNGRTARALMTLELVRGGYPPAIIRRKQERERYINALQESDSGGDIGPFAELVLSRMDAALTGLESAAREKQGYSVFQARLRSAREARVRVWNSSVRYLFERLMERLQTLDDKITVEEYVFSEGISLDEYTSLCDGVPISHAWAFRVRLQLPGLSTVERLAWVGYRSDELMRSAKTTDRSPSLFWSERNPQSYPPWRVCYENSPGLQELSISPTNGDEWAVRHKDGRFSQLTTTKAVEALVEGFVKLLEG